MAKVKARARPWRSIFLLVLTEAVAVAAALAFGLLTSVGMTGLAGRAHEVLQPKLGTAHAAVIRYAIVLLGGLATILIALQPFGIAVTELLVGGAFATVLVGIAAQQSLSNVFAGLVLLLARQVDVGDRVWIRSGPLEGELRGTVTEIGITYVRLDTRDGPLHLPNSQILASAIAPVFSSPPDRTRPAVPADDLCAERP